MSRQEDAPVAGVLKSIGVGRTSLKVSLLGLGAAPLAGLYGAVPEAQAHATVRRALSAGMTFFDTAPRYGDGLSERRLGRVLADYPRDSYVLASKVGWELTPQGALPAFSRDGVMRGLEASLERLGLERIDIVHIHDLDDHGRAALDEVFPVLAELRGQGVIGAVGAGMNDWRMLAEFARHADFDCFLLAGRYTLLEQGALHEFLPLCQDRGISVFLGGVYNSGILATGARPGAKYNYTDAPPAVLERVRRLEEVCARHDVALKAAALQFPLAHPAVTALIVGAASAAEVAANLEAFQTPLPPELWLELRAEGLVVEDAPLPL